MPDTSDAMFFVSASPCLPVQAFAFPLLAITARKVEFSFDNRFFEYRTGAAWTSLVVKTPAALHDLCEKIIPSPIYHFCCLNITMNPRAEKAERLC